MTLAIALPRRRALPSGAVVALLAFAYAAWWGFGMAWSHRAPTLDDAEQLVWSYALEAGYWKHPPLPSWILHVLVRWFGPSVALPFYAAEACAALALAVMWRLGCEFMAPRRSLAATALTSLIAYHGFGNDAYNHDVVLLPFQAAASLFFYLALRRGRWRDWALAGALAALALLAKYVALFALAPLLLVVVLDRGTHTRRVMLGLALAAGVALLVLLPHLWWLQANDFLPLRYAASVAAPASLAACLRKLGDFLVTQLWRALPLLLALAWTLWRAPARDAPEPIARNDRLFLWVAGAGPLLLIVAYALATRTPLISRWGTNLLLFTGWLVLDALRGWRLPDERAVLRTCLALQAALWLVVTVLLPRGGEALGLHGRWRFPGAVLAAAAQHTWREQTGAPLRIVVSDVWLGGNVVAHAGAPLAVLVDGEPARAPWISDADLARCGALVLQERNGEEAPPGVARYLARASDRGTWSLPWSRSHAGDDVRIAWGVLRPTAPGGCRL